ncbi:hypothetical protein [Pseudomonas sp. UBA6310]|uniref:hypothetical protein n=1 Tax=Pseudomonas sp. UBA6310 TaxID=1947327 RepID=UPI00257EFBBD|nr:hypothetical protein [Pseudomonas sp. UBA6310]
MSAPQITLGGIPLSVYSGAPDQSGEPLEGATLVRMSEGAGVKMSHWGKAAGSISGQGLLPLGLDALDYGSSLELRLTMPKSIASESPIVTLTTACRPDRSPWAYALVDGDWKRTPCALAGDVATATEVPGAERYLVQWMPMYQVFASEPPTSMNTAHGWTINWEEA